MKKSFTIHDLPLSERPRERLLQFGVEVLSVQELLALLLGRGVKEESVMVTAQKLLSEFGGLDGIAGASIEELSQVRGIGLANSSQIKAAFELGRRLENYPAFVNMPIIKAPEDVVKLIKARLKGKKRERFLIVLLNTRNQVIGVERISLGSLNTSIVHPREVFKEAISASAASIILAHNHPSGNPQPSEDDIKLTERLVEVGRVMGIDVLDHLIICDREYLSMKNKGMF
ncbi:MAG: DNA repair protein RadC [Dehalococcoidia bacterium]|nr:DNA repair protein RadC [Dehalococcoidia bacterium]